MLEVYERLGLECVASTFDRIVLNHEQRTKGRLRTRTVSGEEVRLFLDRGRTLEVGEFLLSNCGTCIRVDGAEEEVAVASCEDWRTFSRACYHLGNRHVKVNVGSRWLHILPDHVLEDMLSGLGMTITKEQHVFVPEHGAYSQGHSHSHSGSHSHSHSHEHA